MTAPLITSSAAVWQECDVRWSPRLKQSEKDLYDADNCRVILLLFKDVGKQLLHRLLPEEESGRKDEG